MHVLIIRDLSSEGTARKCYKTEKYKGFNERALSSTLMCVE